MISFQALFSLDSKASFLKDRNEKGMSRIGNDSLVLATHVLDKVHADLLDEMSSDESAERQAAERVYKNL